MQAGTCAEPIVLLLCFSSEEEAVVGLCSEGNVFPTGPREVRTLTFLAPATTSVTIIVNRDELESAEQEKNLLQVHGGSRANIFTNGLKGCFVTDVAFF